MDATVNELEHTKISSFPTLTFYPKGDSPKVLIYYLLLFCLLQSAYARFFLCMFFKQLILYTITKTVLRNIVLCLWFME